MAADHVSYQRARGISLLGLGLQLTFGIVLLLYSLFQNPFTLPAAVLVLLGAPIWIALALVFHQHVLERRESEEAAAFRESEAAAASVFEGSATDVVVQASRLQWMHKYLLPAIGLALGAAHVGVGLWLYSTRIGLSDFPEEGPPLAGLALAIGAIGGLVAFIFARYAAGMAKERTWLLLNGGAAAAIGMTLMGALIAVSHFLVNAADSIWLLANFRLIVGVYSVLLGAEMVLNFVLNLYRPRSAGEFLRPAFDSRVLAYVAAPDRLAQSISDAVNYQFGFGVSSTWFYRLLSRWVLVLLGVMLLIGWLMTSFVVVSPHERGLMLAGGDNRGVIEPGPVVKAPWPFARVERFPATALNDVRVGLPLREEDEERDDAASLWATDDPPGELLFVVQPSAGRVADGGDDGSYAVASLTLRVLFLIDDVESYFLLAQDGPADDRDAIRQELLTGLASSEATVFLGSVRFDRLIAGLDPSQIQLLRSRVQRRFDLVGAGVRVTSVNLIGASPPKDAAVAYESSVASTDRRASAVQAARAEAESILTEAAGSAESAREILSQLERLEGLEGELSALRRAGGSAAEVDSLSSRVDELSAEVTQRIVDSGGLAAGILAQARGDRREIALEALGDVFRSEGRLALYRAAPQVYKAELMWRTLSRAVRQNRVWIVPDEHLEFDLEQLEIQQTLDIAPPSGEEE